MSDSDDIDPSIAALLKETADSLPESKTAFEKEEADIEQKETAVNLEEISEPSYDNDNSNGEVPQVDLSVTSFKPITKFFEDTPSPIFDDPAYYKTVLTGEGEVAQRVHQLLVKYLKCLDPKDKTVYRQQLVSSYWALITEMIPKLGNVSLPTCKRMLIRFGVILPSLFSPEQKNFFSRSIMNNTTGEPIYYIDEWMKEIASGRITLSATDETPTSHKGPNEEQQRIQQLKSKNSGKLQSAEGLVNAKESERSMMEQEINDRIRMLFDHPSFIGLEPHKMPYNEMQKKLFIELADRFRSLQKIDKELASNLKEFQETKDIQYSLDQKLQNVPEEATSVGKEEINTEISSIRQMAKMTVGRQGNQFPIFTREFFHCFDKSTGFRENVLRELSWIESLDPSVFCRIHKNIPHRIVPYVILVPTYGDSGMCWEPFDRYNRVTSRGRIVIPMYPRDLKIACIMAAADLRWQVAKEKASYYWMEEGLTGQYFQWIDSQKLKGDLKNYFIDDYIIWLTKEANGVQRLSKEVRAIFWRFIPFPQSKKDELKTRSIVYQELYQRDLNRSMSDGY